MFPTKVPPPGLFTLTDTSSNPDEASNSSTVKSLDLSRKSDVYGKVRNIIAQYEALEEINLTDCGLESEDANALADELVVNDTLKSITLSKNRFMVVGC